MTGDAVDDGRVLDPRSGCLVAVATVLLAIVVAFAGMVALVLAPGIECDVDCGRHIPALVPLAFPGASGAVVAGGGVAWVTAQWRWFLAGAAAAATTLAAVLAFG